jgi:simple sugar transport system ATP-binding protein
MAISDKVTVLRDGRVVITTETKKTDPKQLAKWMVGREVLFRLEKKSFKPGKVVLDVKNLTTLDDLGLTAVKGISFQVREGEIFGIAGVAGNGQRELVEALTGLRKIIKGNVIINGKDITNRSSREIIEQGVGHIPEDRYKHGLVKELAVYENCMLDSSWNPHFYGKWKLYDKNKIFDYSKSIVKEYNVMTPSINTEAKLLSGGNLQKLILARELSRTPPLLIANQPTRGVDVGATEFVRSKLEEQREKGQAILLVSAELEEILSLSDNIAVMYEGEITGVYDAQEADMHEIGLAMGGFKK